VIRDEVGRAPVSQFFGIAIAMYQTDRTPPHFHAGYDGHEALISIDTLEFVEGWLPKRAYALVLEWAAQHRAELRANWDRARQGLPLERIVPLE
jgi:Domain of unknown function (DUF4160)